MVGNTFEGRQGNIKKICGAVLTNPKYPVCLVNDQSPYSEKIMSMPAMITEATESNTPFTQSYISGARGTYFFFLFNLENYFHFLYDTIPYLHFYFVLKGIYPEMKILISPEHKWLPFQRETIELLGLEEGDFVRVEEGQIYETLFIPPSLTHNGHSNKEPSAAAWTIWQRLIEAVGESHDSMRPKKFYVSRRSWIHGQLENIGTNYTARRKCINEDALVAWLAEKGVKEVFCETMSMRDKISLFTQADEIWGFAGGGMVNCLFAQPSCRTICIDTPEFLKINSRFLFSTQNTNQIVLYDFTEHAPHGGPWPLYTRVKEISSGRIGEIEEWDEIGQAYVVNLSNNDVAGFSFSAQFEKKKVGLLEIEPLDGGLNSPFCIDIEGISQLSKINLFMGLSTTSNTIDRNENNYSNERGRLAISRGRL